MRSAIRIISLSLLLMLGCSARQPDIKPYQVPPDTVLKPQNKIPFYSVTELAEKIRSEELTSFEVVNALLNQIHLFNPELNAIVTINEAAVRQRAREADAALAKGIIWGPLHGVPVTIKDQFATKGLKTTNGWVPHAEQITDFDATIVKRFKDAGAIILGKTNLPPMAMDLQTSNDIFGTTNNPWDTARTPGGSSGGGAASVASGMSPFDFGSDLAGSLRVPAHFCGIYSLKCTENMIPNTGIAPGFPKKEFNPIRYMISLGFSARSIADLKYCLPIVAGPDQKDINVPLPDLQQQPPPGPSQLRVAWSDNFGDVPITEDSKQIIRRFVRNLEQQGCVVQRTDPKNFDYHEAWETWGKMQDLQFGMFIPSPARFLMYTLGWKYRKTTPLAQMVYPISYEKFLKTLTQREVLISNVEQFFQDWDVFICPVSSSPAIHHQKPDAVRMNLPVYRTPVMIDQNEVNYWTALSAYAAPFNLTGNPVVTIPAGHTSEGLPVGIQIVGPRWSDMNLLEKAQVIDTIAGGYKKPEKY